MTQNKETVNFYQELVQEALGNPEFKKQLLNNPKQTMEGFSGKKMNIPEGMNLVVQDQTDESTIYINLTRNFDTDELSEEQLELVAGGTHPDEGHSPNLVYEVFYHATKTVMSWFE